MIKIRQAVIVEGKYDKIKLSSIIDAPIICTDGFGIFKDKELQRMIRMLAEKDGILVLTDSDSAGFKIRNFIGSTVDKKYIRNAYIPDIFGKEKRKAQASKEGKLGVEGIDRELLLKAFEDAGVVGSDKPREIWIDKQRLIDDGLSGGENSSELRRELCAKLKLPERISAKGLLEALNTLYTEEEYTTALSCVIKGE